MFLGECLCLIVFKILVVRSRTTGKPVDTAKPFPLRIFLLPAMCDMTGTSLMYVGLSYTYASTFQMLRGIVVVFTGATRALHPALFGARTRRLHCMSDAHARLRLARTAILSVSVLKKRLKAYQWTGVGLVLVGTSIVGVAAALGPATGSAPNPALGDAFIIAAQARQQRAAGSTAAGGA